MQQQLMKAAERLLPKFQIVFENESPFVEEIFWGESEKWRRVYIRIKVVNDSAKTIENVSVCIERFAASGPMVFEGIPLRLMHNDSVPPRRFFSLHPESGQFMDVATKDSSRNDLTILHAYEGKRKIETDEKEITICVVATGLNAVPAKRRFRLHVDTDGVLHCEPLDPVEVISLLQ
jgi:hypothetical protein